MTDPGLGAAGIEQLMDSVRRSLEQVRAAQPEQDGKAAGLRGEGEAADGRIRAVALPPYRLESLRIDPSLSRMESAALSSRIVEAVNAALDDLRGQVDGLGAGVVRPDPEKLAGQLREVQDEAVRRMAMFVEAMNEVVARLGQRPDGSGRA
jgi:DNA-binding protein YbaB